MKTRRLVFAAALFGAVLPAAAQPTGFLLDPRVGYVSPSGSIQVSTSAAFGSTAAFDTKSDLGYKGQSDFLPNVRYVADRYRFEVSYQTSSFHDAAALRELLGLRPAPEFEAWLEGRGLMADGRLTAQAGDARGLA